MEINKFLYRFNNFYDSVLRRLEISFRSAESPTIINIEISAKDNLIKFEDNWCNVVLRLIEVEHFNLLENTKESCQVLSNGMNVLKIKDLIYIDFGYLSYTPKSLEDFQESKFCIASKEISWEVKDYRE